jgi:hypothetical protein
MKRLLPALLICAFVIASRAVPAGAVMPALPTESLSGRQLSVPMDLPSVPCLLVVGYSKASRSQTEYWSRRLQGLVASDALAIYSVSVIEDVPTFLRAFVIGGIRGGVPERLYDRFLVVSKQSPDWKAMTAYTEPDIAYLVLINSGHEIVWHTSGPVTDSSIQALTTQLKEIARPVQAQQSAPGDAPPSHQRP